LPQMELETSATSLEVGLDFVYTIFFIVPQHRIG
jgi:hypothetical protein